MAMNRRTARRGRERRGSERAHAKLSMQVEAGANGAAKIVTESQNISSSGVYCHASHYLAPLSKVQLTIVLPPTPASPARAQDLVKCDGIVVRCDQRAEDRGETPYELACMFTGLEPDLRGRLEEFVTWRNLQALRAALSPGSKSTRPAARGGARSGGSRRSASARAATPKATARRRSAARRKSASLAKAGAKRGAGKARR